MTEIWLAFLTGLTGSIHCIGMCGGIVAAVSFAGEHVTPVERNVHHLLYNLGRITTYSLMGAAAGWFGTSLDLLSMREFSFWVFAGANAFVMVIGLVSFLHIGGFGLFALETTAGRFLIRPVRGLLTGNSSLRFYPLGIILGFLPCGLVYAPLITAVTSGGTLVGLAIMAALGVGTLPVMLAVGSFASMVSDRLRGVFFRLAGLCVALMGFIGMWRVLAKAGHLPPFPL